MDMLQKLKGLFGRRGRKLRNPKCNPSRYKRLKYLGKKVQDINECGLDSLKEVERICRAILDDYRAGRISKRTANGRFARLHNTIIPRNEKLKGKKRKAKAICKKYWNRLKSM